ncbi:hypothetical protein [Actinoplanes auranticolor]|uniref:Uncharacterized protein n=1 Tax=Actinoplanes auranticolor TaxID=47988 RepID=A0A919VLP0_9ACTN|nr:hypothetical protein [Actinoplanes auranticolor]GIM67943.1 hypothetical protein Aau02nite_29500 [Actinoplanes auranticolor]
MSGLQAIAVQHGQAVAAQVGDRVRVSVEVHDAGPTGAQMIEPDHLDPSLDQPANQRIGATDTQENPGCRDHYRVRDALPGYPESLYRQVNRYG